MPFDNKNLAVAFLPDGRPAPAVLTAEETALFLRLGGNGKAERTLKYWRDQGLLRGVRLGKTLRYRLCDVEAFLDRKTGTENASVGSAGRRSLGQNGRL
jgi:hypothetical protein